MKHKLRIQSYNYTYQYKQGDAANLADYFSRHTNKMHKEINSLELKMKDYIEAVVQTYMPTALTNKEIQQTMRDDL